MSILEMNLWRKAVEDSQSRVVVMTPSIAGFAVVFYAGHFETFQIWRFTRGEMFT